MRRWALSSLLKDFRLLFVEKRETARSSPHSLSTWAAVFPRLLRHPNATSDTQRALHQPGEGSQMARKSNVSSCRVPPFFPLLLPSSPSDTLLHSGAGCHAAKELRAPPSGRAVLQGSLFGAAAAVGPCDCCDPVMPTREGNRVQEVPLTAGLTSWSVRPNGRLVGRNRHTVLVRAANITQH